MPRVFGHGGLRLVLLSLLEDGPRHGYELIVALEDRFMGMYRPSSGTVYPRLAALEQEGLISSVGAEGKRVYSITDAGREELARRRAELDETVTGATSAVRAVMAEIQAGIKSTMEAVQSDVEGLVADAKRAATREGFAAGWVADETRTAARETRRAADDARQAIDDARRAAADAGRDAWHSAEEARRVAVDEAKRVRRMAEDLRRQARSQARERAPRTRDAARDAARDVLDAARVSVREVDVDDIGAEMAGWVGEAVTELRRRLPDEDQRSRLRAALDAARRAFIDALGDGPEPVAPAQPPGDGSAVGGGDSSE